MGILYFFGFGIAGAGGSVFSGMLLDTAAAITGSSIISFKILFIILIVISGITLYLMRKLVPLGALPFKGAMEVMFSYRELKAISLLDKLNKTSDSGMEEAILGALQDSPSGLAIKGLLARVKSPRLPVRMESIRAIDALSGLDEDAERALMDDIINNPFTTAYRSARTLGNHGVFQAIPLLRELAVSSDYMLAGEAMIALAKLMDVAFKPLLEQIVMETQNPRLRIAGVEAIGIFGFTDSLPILLDLLRVADPPPYLRDEVVMAMASILNIDNKYYSLLIRFLANESLAVTLAMDEAESTYEYYLSVHGRKRAKKDPGLTSLQNQAKAFQSAVSEYMQGSKGEQLYRWIMDLPDDLVNGAAQMILAEITMDEDFMELRRLKLLIVQWSAHQLRLWTNNLKKE
jgi:hypothetical protein